MSDTRAGDIDPQRAPLRILFFSAMKLIILSGGPKSFEMVKVCE